MKERSQGSLSVWSTCLTQVFELTEGNRIYEMYKSYHANKSLQVEFQRSHDQCLTLPNPRAENYK